jgi:hypothetical protein
VFDTRIETVSPSRAASIRKAAPAASLSPPIASPGPVDIALLPTAGHAVEPYTCGAYEYLIDRLAPRAVYLMHGNYGRENYWKCAARLQKRGVRVEFPENEGDRFHFQQGARRSGARPCRRRAHGGRKTRQQRAHRRPCRCHATIPLCMVNVWRALFPQPSGSTKRMFGH